MTSTSTLNLEENDYRRVYFIGDIHANMDDLATVIALIYEDGYDNRIDGLIFLGDMIDSYDKGEAARVVETVREMCNHKDVFALRGNHEQMLIDAVNQPLYSQEFMISYGQGMKQTLESYQPAKEEWSSIFIPPKKMRSDIEWFKSLPSLIVGLDYYAVHAGLKPIIGAATSEHDRLWIRDEFLNSDYDFGKIVVHGHTARTEVEVKKNRINIDTSKYGRVSAMRLQSGWAPVFIDRYGRYRINEKGESVYDDHSSGVEF